MKRIKLLLVLLISQLALSQTDFSNGYQQGYVQGQNYNTAYNLSYVLPPLTPMPTLIESTFQDGYNRGLIESYSEREHDTVQYYYYEDKPSKWTKIFNDWLIDYETDMKNMIENPKEYFENKKLSIYLQRR